MGATTVRQRSPSSQPSRWPFVAVGAALFVLLMGANLPTPLYAVYRQRFGFSSTVLTLVFATYAVVLVPSLLVFGQLSDRLGRRRVILLGLGTGLVALALFALARDTGWLYAARAVQGIALGATAGTATAALVELEPNGSAERAARAAAVGLSGGSAAAPVLAGVLAEWAPAPLVLPYLVGAVATVAVGVAVWRLAERQRPSGAWRLQRPSVPAEVRVPFFRAGLTAAALWSVGALFVSIVPTYAGILLSTRNLALLGTVAGGMLGVACGAQTLSVRSGLPSGRAQAGGLLLLVAGVAALIGAFPLHSLALLLTAAALAGAGLGVGFFGAQAEVNHLAPADRRGEVTAAFITCIYAGVATATIAVGLLADAVSLFTAVFATGTAIAALSIALAFWHVRGPRKISIS